APVWAVTSVAPATLTDVTYYVSTLGADSNAGTLASPVRTIQRAVNLASLANSNGQTTKVSIAAGVYRESVLLDAVQTNSAAMIIEGAPGTVLSGADVWSSGWTAIGNNSYTHAWPYRWGAKPIPTGWEWYWNNDGKGFIRNRILRSEMVLVNDQPFGARLSASELVPGTFYVDETNGQITVKLLATQGLPIA